MTTTILDLENWTAGGATAVLLRKCLTVRLTFRLNDAPVVPYLGTIGKPSKTGLAPQLMSVEYSKVDDKDWVITSLRVYGHRPDDPAAKLVNIYPHELMKSRAIPAWIRDAAYRGAPDFKEDEQ